MTQFNLLQKKDLGLQREVMDALPYAVVGGAWEGSLLALTDLYTALVHIVPAGHQLKILFLRVWTQNSNGCKFSIVQSNPATLGLTGTIEAFPVVGSVPPFIAGATAVRDYPMLEAAGAEVLRGGVADPVHVLEGSINFNIIHKYPTGTPLTGDRIGVVYWGFEKIPE
jgi:hypothetical protein